MFLSRAMTHPESISMIIKHTFHIGCPSWFNPHHQFAWILNQQRENLECDLPSSWVYGHYCNGYYKILWSSTYVTAMHLEWRYKITSVIFGCIKMTRALGLAYVNHACIKDRLTRSHTKAKDEASHGNSAGCSTPLSLWLISHTWHLPFIARRKGEECMHTCVCVLVLVWACIRIYIYSKRWRSGCCCACEIPGCLLNL